MSEILHNHFPTVFKPKCPRCRLNKAAPKLLAACETVVRDLECFSPDEPADCVVCQCEAAIAAAKGD